MDLIGTDTSFEGKDGKLYQLSPLRMKELAAFVNWVRWKPYKDALETGIPEEQLQDIKLNCLRGKCQELVGKHQNGIEDWREYDIHWESTIVQRERFSLDGIRKQLELSLRIKYPNADLDEIFPEETILEIYEELARRSGIIANKVLDEKDIEDAEKN